MISKSKFCKECGESFAPRNNRSMFCSVFCRIKGRSIQTASGCWEFQGPANHNGYAAAYDGAKVQLAHRAMFECLNGAQPTDIHICHRCDNRICVNPDHLFAGTRLDNMRDAAAKLRMPYGESHPNAKLTEADVVKIRASTLSLRATARQFGVGQTAIFQIRKGEYWKRVA